MVKRKALEQHMRTKGCHLDFQIRRVAGWSVKEVSDAEGGFDR